MSVLIVILFLVVPVLLVAEGVILFMLRKRVGKIAEVMNRMSARVMKADMLTLVSKMANEGVALEDVKEKDLDGMVLEIV